MMLSGVVFQMNIEKKVVSIIVTYNRIEKLKKAWAAISCQNIYGIVIVNNNSSDGTQEWIDAINDQRLKPLHLKKNIGGAGGFRKGCEFGLKVFPNADWFLLFDDDAYAQPNLIKEFFNISADCDLVSSKVLTPSGISPKMNMPLLNVPTSIYDVLNYLLKPDKFSINSIKHNEAVRVAVSSFVGLFISYRCLKHMLYAMRPEFFIYCDDAYFTYNTFKSGYVNFYMPNLMFFHDVASFKVTNTKLYYLLRNDIIIKKEYSPKYNYFLILFKFIYYAAKVFLINKSLKHIPIMFRAFRDGFKENFSNPYRE